MNPLVTLVSFFTLAIHLVLIAVVVLRADPIRRTIMWWSVVFGGLSAIVALLYLPPDGIEGLNLRLYSVIVMIMGFGAFGYTMLYDLKPHSINFNRLRVLWTGIVLVWLLSVIFTAIINPATVLGQSNWFFNVASDLSALVTLLGFIVAGGLLLVVELRLFYGAGLPELANRAIYWIMLTALCITGMSLIAGGEVGTIIFGEAILIGTLVGVIYAVLNHRVFDIRGSLGEALISVLVMGFVGVLIFVVIYATSGMGLSPTAQDVMVMGVIAILIALVLIPLRHSIEFGMRLIVRTTQPTTAEITRHFSERVAQASNLNEVIFMVTQTLNELINVRESAVMLINRTSQETIEMMMMAGKNQGENGKNHRVKRKTLEFPLDSPVYEHFAVKKRSVTRYDLLNNPLYAHISQAERQLFDELSNYSVFTPIIMDQSFIGLLACGLKLNDHEFTNDDLSLLATLAQHTGQALRNARLVADLRHLNDSMRSLNRGLEEANQELERLDSVKSDFVTIASHELRTPLAQIRGYTDMIDAINEQGMLEQDMVSGMVNNLRKASERMEELIAAMLDVSQLDVKAMDLRFAATTPETVLRMAIEPLTEEIKQRKLNVSARWKGLPNIQADLQRLVQAFRNIIVNAIKFTPDGGHIEIVAKLQEAQKEGETDSILISISDTGVGIDKENHELIFKKFFRTYDPSLHSTGTYKFLGAGPGLGLTIAKGVIEAHGGRIWVESSHYSLEELPGSTFYVVLPVIAQEGKRLSIESEAKPITNP